MKLATISDNGKIKAGMIVGEEFICCDEGKNANTAVLAMISSGNISEWQAMLDKAPRKKLNEIKISPELEFKEVFQVIIVQLVLTGWEVLWEQVLHSLSVMVKTM